MKSKINPQLEVSKEQCVVSLIESTRIKDHAVIVIESVGLHDNDEGLCMRWYDFLPAKAPTPTPSRRRHWYASSSLFLFSALKNKLRDGDVRFCPENNGEALQNIPDDMDKSEIFTQIKWHQDCDSWACATENVKLMIKALEEDLVNHISHFQLRGKPDGVNCLTWAWEKLAIAGIDAKNKNIHNWIAIQPKHNIGSRR